MGEKKKKKEYLETKTVFASISKLNIGYTKTFLRLISDTTVNILNLCMFTGIVLPNTSARKKNPILSLLKLPEHGNQEHVALKSNQV